MNNEKLIQEKSHLEHERDRLANHVSQCDHSVKAYERFQANYAKQTKENTALKTKQKNLLAQNRKLLQEIETVKEERDTQVSTNKTLSNQLQHLTAQTTATNERVSSFDQVLEKKQVELEELQQRFAELRDTSQHEIEQLKNNIKLGDISVKNAENEAMKCREIKQSLESENSSLEEKIASFQENPQQ